MANYVQNPQNVPLFGFIVSLVFSSSLNGDLLKLLDFFI